ncbi:unnamed protein product, partial [Rotaria sp. Silwood1]
DLDPVEVIISSPRKSLESRDEAAQ